MQTLDLFRKGGAVLIADGENEDILRREKCDMVVWYSEQKNLKSTKTET